MQLLFHIDSSTLIDKKYGNLNKIIQNGGKKKEHEEKLRGLACKSQLDTITLCDAMRQTVVDAEQNKTNFKIQKVIYYLTQKSFEIELFGNNPKRILSRFKLRKQSKSSQATAIQLLVCHSLILPNGPLVHHQYHFIRR